MTLYEQTKQLVEKWGLKVEVRTEESRTSDGMDATLRCLVDVVRPTAAAIEVSLRLEHLGDKLKRIVGQGDPITGDEVFDKAVWVDTDTAEGEAMRLLDDQGVRAALLEALRLAKQISLGSVEVKLCAVKTGMLANFGPGEIADVERAAVDLAVAVESWVRQQSA